MDTRSVIILTAGFVICAAIFFIDFYFFHDIYGGGMAAVILVVIGMSFFIMQDARFLPEIGVSLTDDAKGIIVINHGNDNARLIHVSIVPHNIEFDIPSLAADARHEYPLSAMLTEAKAVVSYQNSKGLKYSQTFGLSALGKSDDNLLKPAFPMFKWK
ncbi:MAG: hypothetical protein NTY71_07320 [Methanoregula sp.]|jgi:hypothetical protein|nr:hypothetical protein [Methanoregula sp.]